MASHTKHRNRTCDPSSKDGTSPEETEDKENVEANITTANHAPAERMSSEGTEN